MTLGVREIPDEELLRRAIKSARPPRGQRKSMRWVGVMDTFALGSTYAIELCERFGFNPHEDVFR